LLIIQKIIKTVEISTIFLNLKFISFSHAGFAERIVTGLELELQILELELGLNFVSLRYRLEPELKL
jgi:hypothetical protein